MTDETDKREQPTGTEQIVLYGAQGVNGRLYLTDDPARLPADAQDAREFRVNPDRVEWAILQVQVEELRGALVCIHVGDCRYATDAPFRQADATAAEAANE